MSKNCSTKNCQTSDCDKMRLQEAENEGLKKNFYYRCVPFFKKKSSMNIRWKKTWWKDFSSPAVYFDEFLEEFTRAELSKMVALDLIKDTYMIEPKNGSRKRVLVFKGKILPQTNPYKAVFADGTIWAMISIFIVVTMVVLFLFTKFAWSMGKATNSPPEIKQGLPAEMRTGWYYVTNENGAYMATCIWLKNKDMIALSCK